jgi:alpha-glucosidase
LKVSTDWSTRSIAATSVYVGLREGPTPWFVDSRSSRTSGKRDWFVWADPDQGGGPRNNWLSRFGGSAWEWDELTGQYYYHWFLKIQPDLNWRNPRVRAAMADVLRFWMKRGSMAFGWMPALCWLKTT